MGVCACTCVHARVRVYMSVHACAYVCVYCVCACMCLCVCYVCACTVSMHTRVSLFSTWLLRKPRNVQGLHSELSASGNMGMSFAPLSTCPGFLR